MLRAAIDAALAEIAPILERHLATALLGASPPPANAPRAKPVTSPTPPARAWKPPPPGRMTKRQVRAVAEHVFSLFAPGKELRAGDVMAATGLDRHRATNALTELVEARKLQRDGVNRYTTYRLRS